MRKVPCAVSVLLVGLLAVVLMAAPAAGAKTKPITKSVCSKWVSAKGGLSLQECLTAVRTTKDTAKPATMYYKLYYRNTSKTTWKVDEESYLYAGEYVKKPAYYVLEHRGTKRALKPTSGKTVIYTSVKVRGGNFETYDQLTWYFNSNADPNFDHDVTVHLHF